MNKLSTTLVSAAIAGLMSVPAMAGTATSKILDVQNPSTGVLSFRKDDMNISGCASIYTGVIDPETGGGIYGYYVKLDSYLTDPDVQEYVDFALAAQLKVTINIDCDGPVYTGNSIQIGDTYTFYSPGESFKSKTTVFEDSDVKVQLNNKKLYIEDKNTGETIWTQSTDLNLGFAQQSKLEFTSSGELKLKTRIKTFFGYGNWTDVWDAGVSNANSLLKFDACGMQVINTNNESVRWENDFDSGYSQSCDR